MRLGMRWEECHKNKTLTLDKCMKGYLVTFLNPPNAEAAFVQSTMIQIFLKPMWTLSFWYSLDSSHWGLSDAYPYARGSVTFCRFLHHFVLAKLAISSIRVKRPVVRTICECAVYLIIVSHAVCVQCYPGTLSHARTCWLRLLFVKRWILPVTWQMLFTYSKCMV